MSGAWAPGSLAPLCRTLLQIGLGVLLQSTLLLGLGLLAGGLLRRRGAPLVSLLYQVTLIGTLVGAAFLLALGPRLQPPWSVSLPAVSPHPALALDGGPASPAAGEAPARGVPVIDPLRLPEIPAPSSHAGWLGQTTPQPSGHEDSPAVSRAAGAGIQSPPERSGMPAGLLMGWLYVATVAVWAMGAALLLFRLLLCRIFLDRLRRRAVPIHSQAVQTVLADLCRSLQVRPPRLLAGPGVNSPFLTGLRHPVILLPADYEQQLEGPTLRLILAHELIHLARRDCGWNLLARLSCALGWTQPLLWVLCRRLEQAGEELCDQEVIRLEGEPRVYARCLLTLSEQFLPSLPARALGVGVVVVRSSLGRRIQRILDSARHPPRPPSRRLRTGITLVASIVVILGLFLASAIAAPPGERADRSQQILRTVPELDKSVTYTETKIPLGELVQRVAADTGAPLVAAPEVADEPVAVVVKAIPARELLEQLADLLDYTWSRRTESRAPNNEHPRPIYEIWQDLASKQREEALRNALRADVIRRFEEEMHRYTDMADWTPERLQKFLDDAHRPTRADDPNASERARRFFPATALTSPITRAVTQLLGRLSPEQWATVREGKILTLSTDPKSGELAMPAETASVLRAARPTLYPPGAHIRYDDPNGPEQTRRMDQGMQDQWAAATGYRVTIQIDADNWRNLNMLQLTAAAKPFRTGAPAGSDFFMAYAGTSVQIKTEPSDPMARDEDRSQPSEAELAKDPVFGARQLFKPEVKPRHEWSDEPSVSALFRLRDLLPDLARTYKVQFIADAYTPVNARVAAPPSTEPEALYQVLSRTANPTHRWDRRGNLIRLRSRTWFLDRPKEIPLRLVRHWKELADQHGALPLKTYLEIASTLTDLQLENVSHVGEDVDLPQTVTPFLIGRARYGLRLYAALSPEQQQALGQGKSLPVAQMTPAQRQLFLASLEERSRYEPRSMSLEQWPSGRLSLEAEPRTVVVDRPSAGARHLGLPGASPESVSPASRPGQTPSQPPTTVGPGSGSPSQPDATTHHLVTRLTLHFWYASDQDDAIDLTVASLR